MSLLLTIFHYSLNPSKHFFSLMSQILGLYSDKLVIEVMVGTLFLVSQSKEQLCFNYDEFLVERINSQLDNFHNSGKVFRYQTLLMLIVINSNLQTLQQMEPVLFVDNVNLSERNSSMTFINFIDKIMASIYKLIFGTTLPRITQEMKAYFQNSNEPVGDWFLYNIKDICI